jgi:hypothetical protein
MVTAPTPTRAAERDQGDLSAFMHSAAGGWSRNAPQHATGTV